MPDSDEAKVRELLETGKWSRVQALARIRAKFCCEYCGLDLIDSVAHYKLWQLDHIVPKRVKIERGEDPDDMANLAISCKACNCDFKGGFDPSERNPGAERERLIQVVKECLAPIMARSEAEVANVRRSVGR
jgi:hypothetical protein